MKPGALAIMQKLPPFNPNEAREGKPFVHIFDLPKEKPYSGSVHKIEDPAHPGWLVWAGEWLVYTDDDTTFATLRMYDAEAFRKEETEAA